MKRLMISICAFLMLATVANATQVQERKLSALVKEADHVLGGKIIKVDMIDKDGNEIADEKARTGPGLSNTIRLHIKVDKKLILKTTKEVTPDIIVIDLWQKWHFSLGQIKKNELNADRIFLLKGDNYKRVYPIAFMRNISEKEEILKLLK